MDKINKLNHFVGQPPYKQQEDESRKVICIETQQVFNSTTLADEYMHFKKDTVRHAIYNNKITHGYHFAYLDDIYAQESLKEFVNRDPESAEERHIRLSKINKEAQTKRVYSKEYREIISKRSSKPVICIETQQVFKSGIEAFNTLKALGEPITLAGLSSAASGRTETCIGYH